MDYQEVEGTRLRHVKHKPGPTTHEGPAVYHSLPCFELTDVPPSRTAPTIGSLDPLSILDAVEIESIASEVRYKWRLHHFHDWFSDWFVCKYHFNKGRGNLV